MANPFESGNRGQPQPGNTGGPKHGPFTPTNGAAGGPKPGAERPTALEPQFENIPTELSTLSNWVMWRYEPPKKPGSNWRKVPYQPNGRPADVTKSNTWSSFETCCSVYEQGGFDGIGFVFDGEVGPDGCCYAGIDFDHCFNGKVNVEPTARKRIQQLDTYTEHSVSNTGFHCICRTVPLQGGKKFDGVEVYTKARFFTFTGCGEGKIRVATNELQALIAEAKQNKRSDSNDPFDGIKISKVFDNRPVKSLGEGISTNYWFDLLKPEHKDEVIDYALGVIASKTPFLEVKGDGGDNDQWYRLTTAVARSGAPNAEDIFVKYASAAKNADPEDALRKHFARCQKSPLPKDEKVTVGTLLWLAPEHGADFEKWKRLVPDTPILPPEKRPPLKGGMYSKFEALELLNSHYFVGKRENEATAIHRINNDESLTFLQLNNFKLEVGNVFVAEPTKATLADRFWITHRQRHQRTIVFKPHGTTDPGEYNLWRGWGVQPHEGREKSRSLIRHTFKVICRSDGTKFEYVLKWLAWKMQNPDKHPETVLVIKGGDEGGGKTLLSDVIRMIFGKKHATVITDAEQLFGRFTEFLEPICFLQLEEAIWSGDPKIAGKMRVFITGQQIPIERKYGPRYTIPNRLASIITSNHQHAVALGLRDRRYFVLEADPQHVGDEAYFKRLWMDIHNGGVNEFMHLLLNVELGDWHPRQKPPTTEGYEEMRMSSDTVLQWLQACVNADAVKLERDGMFKRAIGLGSEHKPTWIATEYLRESYLASCKQQWGRYPVNETVFGKTLTEIFGPSYRGSVPHGLGETMFEQGKHPRRPYGYGIPNSEKLQELLDTRLGIPKQIKPPEQG